MLTEVGHHLGAVQLFDRQLCHCIISAQRVNLFIKEFNTDREVRSIGIDINNTAASSVLARLYHKVFTLEAKFLQTVDKRIHLHLHPSTQTQGVSSQRTSRHHFLAQCLGIAHHGQRTATAKFFHHFGAHHHVGILGLLLVVPMIGFAITGREKHHPGFQCLEIIGQIIGILFRRGYQQHARCRHPVGHRSRHGRRHRTSHTVDVQTCLSCGKLVNKTAHHKTIII